ncbi:MAG: glycosyltransferase family 4 protein [Clostridia bacterium]|nr:glycosyltransferase family 4 protein [Clostridia bacterium]
MSSQRIVFLGPLYPLQEEDQILAICKTKPSSAPSVFQWNLIRGMEEAAGHNMEIVNVLPVGTWPNACTRPILPSRTWHNGAAECREVGCVNLPFVKQAMRAASAGRLLRKWLRPGDRVVLYSAYMPFLRALEKLPQDIDVTAIITDLPEYYDLGQTSSLRKALRRMQNRLIDRCMKRVKRFVLLTEQMQEPLKVGDRPWMLMEGICTAENTPAVSAQERAIFYSGTLHYQFGIQTLLKAFHQMQDPTVRLWICGSGEAEQEIRELCKTDPRIVFHGFLSQKEVADLRSRAAVLVNPRTNEGEYTKYSFPSKTMEYMASGKPVVMYRLDGIPREYDPYLFYVPDDGPDALAQTLSHVLDHPEEAQAKAGKAQAFVTENKNRRAQGQRLIDFLQ